MSDTTRAPTLLTDALFTPLTTYTHNVYSVKGNQQAATLTRIGIALADSRGDIQLFINPEHATGKVLLCKKD